MWRTLEIGEIYKEYDISYINGPKARFDTLLSPKGQVWGGPFHAIYKYYTNIVYLSNQNLA